ncbi:hypothetical protein ACFL07_06905 [Pseudomonadota bacterium]
MIGKMPGKPLIVLLFCLSVSSLAAADSWVMSIPYAISAEHIYKVRIEKINGKDVNKALRYPLAAGEHTLTVSPLLDIEWSPDLVEDPDTNPRNKEFKLIVTPGKTYQIAVRVDLEAGIESQLDQSYWMPFVYETLDDS